MVRCVRIEYTIKPDVDLDDVKAAIAEFVASIAAHHPDHRYASFQHKDDPRHFIHVGEIVEDVLADFQRQPFFHRFGEYLRERCESGPEVTTLSLVASAR